MARLGKSPQRELTNHRAPRKITLCMITHIPHIAGYYKDRMNITELSLQSMIENAGENRVFDVVILDQNSCLEWKTKLGSWQLSGWIDNVILLGNNIGKLEGLRFLFNSVQSDIICYTDDDVLFYPDWLEEQEQLLRIPGCELVTGSPVLTKFKFYKTALGVMKDSPSFKVEEAKVGEEYPMRWMEDDGICRGITPEQYLKIVKKEEVAPNIVTYEPTIFIPHVPNGIKAWAVGHHMQLTGNRKEIMKYLPKPTNKLMGMMREWDNAMSDAGILQLCTFERTCRHMGNVMDQQIVNDAIEMELVL